MPALIERLALACKHIFAAIEKFACCGIERKHDILTGLEAGLFDRAHDVMSASSADLIIGAKPPSSPTLVESPSACSADFNA